MAIDNKSCCKIKALSKNVLRLVFENYGYHGFWGSTCAYLNEDQMDHIDKNSIPSESLIFAKNLLIYKNQSGKAKIHFNLNQFRIQGISMTDPDFYDTLNAGNEVSISKAVIVVSIPPAADFTFSGCTSGRGYKFVSKIFDCSDLELESEPLPQQEGQFDYDVYKLCDYTKEPDELKAAQDAQDPWRRIFLNF